MNVVERISSEPDKFEPNEVIIRSMINLRDNQDFIALLKELDERAQRLMLKSIKIPREVRALWVQGRCQEITEILLTFEKKYEIKQVLDAGGKEQIRLGAML